MSLDFPPNLLMIYSDKNKYTSLTSSGQKGFKRRFLAIPQKTNFQFTQEPLSQHFLKVGYYFFMVKNILIIGRILFNCKASFELQKGLWMLKDHSFFSPGFKFTSFVLQLLYLQVSYFRLNIKYIHSVMFSSMTVLHSCVICNMQLMYTRANLCYSVMHISFVT